MAKEEKKAPKLRFNGYTNDWERKKLGIYVPITMGQSPNSKNYTNNPRDNILVQGNADLYNNRVLKRTFTTEVTKIADRNDILIISVRAPVGDIARNQYESVVIGRGIASIKGNDFLYYQLEKMNNSGFWKKYIAGSTFESITGKDLKSSDIYISNHKEEKSIGDIFQTLTKTIQLHERKCEELALIKKALLQKLFPKKDEVRPEVRYKNFSDVWEQRKLGEVIISEHKGKVKSIMKGGNTNYLETNYLNGGTAQKVDALADVSKDDVLILWDGSKAGTIYHGFEGALGSTLKAYVPKYSGDFLYQILKKNQDKIYQSYRTPNIPHVIKNFTEKFNVSIPTIIEQQEIGDFFKQLDSLITLHQRKLEKLKQLKKFLLQNMFI
ncbi:restriction endonuclease subunit S [Ligilactobacillus salivarius]|uniref:Restriction endonuclease subunit S n=2 Tax=Ligilactobacillus salivarius TaxID=1624 RepID=A0A1V9U734_9LACO|nr:restriction endonuclease subunit S [Ligilactobacillus salivarius]OQR25401.1 restriction endonuclease subunit S [Ligilactobacillus salivarius]